MKTTCRGKPKAHKPFSQVPHPPFGGVTAQTTLRDNPKRHAGPLQKKAIREELS